MNDKLVILAAGSSSRMKQQFISDITLTNEEKEQANNRSKSLISIDKSGRPLLDYLLYNAKKAGYKYIYIITQKDNELFKSLYGIRYDNNKFKGLTIHFAIQYIPKNRIKPFGTADALYQALEQYAELKDSTFTVCNSDNLYSINALKLLKRDDNYSNALLSYNKNALQFSEERINQFALMLFNEKGFLIDIIEKPPIKKVNNFTDKPNRMGVSMNIFRFDGRQFFKYLENCPINEERNEKELPTALMNMVTENPTSVMGIPISEHVPDLTSKEDILILKEYIKSNSRLDW